MSSSSSSSASVSSSASSSVGRGIFLRRYVQSRYEIGSVKGYRFRVVAYGASEMDNEIFLYQQRPLDPTTGAAADEFTSVCSPADLEEYPVNAPSESLFFRKSEVDLVFRSIEQADDTWTVLLSEVRTLVRTLDHMDALEPAEIVKVGDPPDATAPE